MSYVLWENYFGGDPTRIKKALFGSVLVRDWNLATTSMSTYSPFDPLTGNLSSTLAADGWTDLGLLSEAGVTFTPKYTTTEVMAWQSRLSQRTDVTVDEEEVGIECEQSTPIIDALRDNIPLSNLPAVGTIGYTITKPIVPQETFRQMIVIGIDGTTGNNEYFGAMYPRVMMIKPDAVHFDAKNEISYKLTFDSYLDPYTGWAVRRFREGPLWRASGGTTTAPGTPVAAVTTPTGSATLTFTPPSSANGPFTYTVNKRTPSSSGTVSSATFTTVSASTSTVVLKVTGLTASSTYDFTVMATGSNGSTSVASAYSNSITST